MKRLRVLCPLLCILFSPLAWAGPLVIRRVTVIDATGNPDVAHVQVPSSMLLDTLLKMGLYQKTAESVIKMWEGANVGLIVRQEARSARNTTPRALESFITETFLTAYLHTV
jgi:hypothetical protein